MRFLQCLSVKPNNPEQIEIGKYYWVDINDCDTADNDAERSVDVYKDRNKEIKVGNFQLKHFKQ